MDKGLTVPKWVLINRPKIPQMPKNLSAQKFGFSMKKGFIWRPKSVSTSNKKNYPHKNSYEYAICIFHPYFFSL